MCRCKQPEDPIIVFKEKVEDGMRAKYKDAIMSLEEEVKRLTETLRLQSMFINNSNSSFFTLTMGPPLFGDLPGHNV